MAHFAKVNENNIVEEVIVVDNKNAETEQAGKDFIASIGLDGNWIQTSYNNNFRYKFAAIGDSYDPIKDEFINEEFLDINYMVGWDGNTTPTYPSVLIDAPARSANMWTCAVINQAFPQAFQRWGYPNPHSIKSFSGKANVFDAVITIIRNPLDVLGSQIVMSKLDTTNNRLINNLIQTEIDFLEAILKNKNNVTIFTFESVTENTEQMVEKLSKILNVIPEPYNKDALVETLNREATPGTEGFYSLPIDNQDELDTVKAILNQERFADLMAKANELYTKLLVFVEA
jgi:hypothetical protein